MMYFIPFILIFLLFIVSALYILFTPSKKNNEDKTAILNNSSNAVSSTSTSSTKQASLGGNKSKDKQTSTTTSPTTRPQATKVYIENFIGRKVSDVISELKSRKITEEHIIVEEEETDDYSPGTILHQSLSEGTLYDLNDSSDIILTVAIKRTSAKMPNYIGSSLEFTKNNLIQIVGVKEANIEVVEVSTSPEGTVEGIVLDQSPKLGESVDLNTTRIKITIYKPKTTTTTQSQSR